MEQTGIFAANRANSYYFVRRQRHSRAVGNVRLRRAILSRIEINTTEFSGFKMLDLNRIA